MPLQTLQCEIHVHCIAAPEILAGMNSTEVLNPRGAVSLRGMRTRYTHAYRLHVHVHRLHARGCVIARDAGLEITDRQTDRQIHTQTKYYNPRCTCALRVKKTVAKFGASIMYTYSIH